MTAAASLRTVLDEARRRRKSLVYYASTADEFVEQFDARNVEVRFRESPPLGPEPFAVIRDDGDDGEVRGVVPVATLRAFVEGPRLPDDGTRRLTPEYRAVLELLDDTVFASLDRRQLLLTSREFEDRAWRVGYGTLHVGFQTPAAFRAQASTYRRLAGGSALDVHVYLVANDETDDEANEIPSIPGVTVHTEPASEIRPYWFLVFDGGGTTDQQFALVAEDRDDGTFYGAWTYDPSLVATALGRLPTPGDDFGSADDFGSTDGTR
ncbi:DICT sensory domain-containing protein [Halogeometricum limi]|uniref:DICT domain-containing protein n=1 Tax=Halogeometricum limi TaxID=555875 RepID=A0A1I6H829_9EURY|nr:DICT sensory domain-containing protein [Halogeometricum limi]SFR50508.1 DICT domain-containing protein [Halogeometricum limi]